MLGFLMHRSMHGYDLYNQFQRHLGRVWHISQSQMYAILKRLEGQGLVQGLIEEMKGSPARRYLAITDEGLRRFSSWLITPTDCGSRILRLEFISRLFFAGMQGPELSSLIVHDQIEALERELKNHERLYTTFDDEDVFNRLGIELRVYHLRAELAWLREAVIPLVDHN